MKGLSGSGICASRVNVRNGDFIKDLLSGISCRREDYAKCKGNEKLAWEKTRDKVIKMLYDDIEANVNIGVHKEIPIRIIKRKN
jgi:hypothetical protein